MQHDFILLDRSGSMASRWVEALGAINGYVKKLADDNVDTGVTMACFDLSGASMSFDILRDRITPKTWKPVSNEDAEPRGSTPLNDATGKIVALAKDGNYDKVAMIIMTDGHENASKELTTPQAKALLDECRAKGWQVIFLGADFDNTAQAASFGNATRSTVTVAAGNFVAALHATASKRGSYGATGQAMGYSDLEKQSWAKKK